MNVLLVTVATAAATAATAARLLMICDVIACFQYIVQFPHSAARFVLCVFFNKQIFSISVCVRPMWISFNKVPKITTTLCSHHPDCATTVCRFCDAGRVVGYILCCGTFFRSFEASDPAYYDPG